MDILYILLDILLKPPQPLMGLFLPTANADGNKEAQLCGNTCQILFCGNIFVAFRFSDRKAEIHAK